MKATTDIVSAEALVLGMIACRDNARELIAEADILIEHGRHARAYALLHTACEELGKFAVLEIGARGLLAGRPPRWNRFWQRLRSHDSKSAQLEVQLMMLAASSARAGDLTKLAKALFDFRLSARNAALYVDRGPDGAFRTPSSLNFSVPAPGLRAVAGHALAVAQECGTSRAEIEVHLRRPATVEMAQQAHDVLAKIVEQMRDLGMTKEQVKHLISKTMRDRKSC
jgi:AbiV family abortive infection protein